MEYGNRFDINAWEGWTIGKKKSIFFDGSGTNFLLNFSINLLFIAPRLHERDCAQKTSKQIVRPLETRRIFTRFIPDAFFRSQVHQTIWRLYSILLFVFIWYIYNQSVVYYNQCGRNFRRETLHGTNRAVTSWKEIPRINTVISLPFRNIPDRILSLLTNYWLKLLGSLSDNCEKVVLTHIILLGCSNIVAKKKFCIKKTRRSITFHEPK